MTIAPHHLLLLLSLLSACEPPTAARPTTVAAPTAEAPDEPEDAAHRAEPDAEEATADATERVAARHIIIGYEGSRRASARAKGRTREAARALAESALARVQGGEPFEDVARELSEDPTAEKGGSLGAFRRGAMQADFERVAFALPVGGLSGVVETPFGFHIIRRDPLVEVHLGQILLSWSDKGPLRTRAEAEARAQEAAARLAAGEPFDAVARALSTGPTAPWGGDLGVVARGQMVPAFDAGAFALKPGETSGIVETPSGFHILRRLE